MKNRKQLPNFGYLKNLSVDVPLVVTHLQEKNLLDYSKYTDIKVSANSKHKNFVIANEFSKSNFFTEDNTQALEGESYVQLYLTDFDETKSSNNVKLTKTSILSRTKRLNPKSKYYLPEADELNYGIRNDLVTDVFSKILNMFSSKITRVRLACLKRNFSIKPHVDYDPSYIVRYHIPLITNEKCKLHIIRNKVQHGIHLPNDGKIYFINAGHIHWASNDSDHDRLHLIIDVHGQNELSSLESLV